MHTWQQDRCSMCQHSPDEHAMHTSPDAAQILPTWPRYMKMSGVKLIYRMRGP